MSQEIGHHHEDQTFPPDEAAGTNALKGPKNGEKNMDRAANTVWA